MSSVKLSARQPPTHRHTHTYNSISFFHNDSCLCLTHRIRLCSQAHTCRIGPISPLSCLCAHTHTQPVTALPMASHWTCYTDNSSPLLCRVRLSHSYASSDVSGNLCHCVCHRGLFQKTGLTFGERDFTTEVQSCRGKQCLSSAVDSEPHSNMNISRIYSVELNVQHSHMEHQLFSDMHTPA